MQDERNAPQDEDEVEAHRVARDPSEALRFGPQEASHTADDDDDEVEAHKLRPSAKIEAKRWEPAE